MATETLITRGYDLRYRLICFFVIDVDLKLLPTIRDPSNPPKSERLVLQDHPGLDMYPLFGDTNDTMSLMQFTVSLKMAVGETPRSCQ